jgi:DNA repair exonuclease SbcCD nuclease subunit
LKIVHLADSHLGFSSYSRVDAKGRNLVEEMIYSGFLEAVERIIQLRPDAVVHAGDVFHHVRPRIRPLYVFKQALERLADAGIPVVVISGNHDAPKSYAAISPFYIYEGMREVWIAHRYRYEPFEMDSHTFHCIPFCLDGEDYLDEFARIERTGQDVLVMHGLVESLRNRKLHTVGEHELRESLLKREFEYIALGHFHGQAQIARNAWYSGSIEYFNFGEAEDTKGILLVDLDRGEVEQIEVRPRYMVDRPPLDCQGLSSEEIAERLLAMCQREEIEGKIVRINLKNVTRDAFRGIDQSRLAKLGAPALHLKIRAEYSGERQLDEGPIDSLRLHEEFVRFMEGERDAIPQAIRGDVLSYGGEVLRRAVTAHNTEALDAPQ